MKILSIETSCDDTGISVLEATGGAKNASFKVLANNVASQIEVHIPYGGVFPALAKREHIKNLPIVLEKTLKESKLSKQKKPVDLIAVTYGPGLEPALWTGIVFAKELAQRWNVPIIPVNHMEGHLLSVFGINKGGNGIKINDSSRYLPFIPPLHTHSELRVEFDKGIKHLSSIYALVAMEYYAKQNRQKNKIKEKNKSQNNGYGKREKVLVEVG